MRRTLSTLAAVVVIMLAVATPADARTKNCSLDRDPFTARSALVKSTGSDTWTGVVLTDSLRKQLIQMRSQSLVTVKWCRSATPPQR